ncbi:YARHG domain-containing protein [Ancylomarina salipaludis]|nr:YARHG domain-containing protein [Ancylomarina salipaludis]
MNKISLIVIVFWGLCNVKTMAQTSAVFHTKQELINMSAVELRLLKNEVFARHGYSFKSADLRDYFNNTSWYAESRNYTNDRLSDQEKEYLERIMSIEKTKNTDYIFKIDSPDIKKFEPKLTKKLIALKNPVFGRAEHESVYSYIKTKATYYEIKRFRITDEIDGVISFVFFPGLELDGNLKLIFFSTFNNQGKEIKSVRLAKYERQSDVYYHEAGFIKGDLIEVRRNYSTVEGEEFSIDRYKINYKGGIIKK